MACLLSSMYVPANYTLDNNDPAGRQKSHSRTDDCITCEHPGSRWSVTAKVHNLENNAGIGVAQ